MSREQCSVRIASLHPTTKHEREKRTHLNMYLFVCANVLKGEIMEYAAVLMREEQVYVLKHSSTHDPRR
jgi:hypothetical protein